MSTRIWTPPPPVDESKYLAVVHPYPLNANLDLHADQRTLALWLACCAGKDVLLSVFYKPSSPEMVVIEVDREFDKFHELLGLHVWSEFLMKPTKEQMDKSSTVFYSTYNTARLVKNGWKRVNIEEHWFQGGTANNSTIRYPYPKTSHCNVPSNSEAKPGAPVCGLLPRQILAGPPPLPGPQVGSAEWLAARNSNAGPTPASTKKGKTAAPSDTAPVTSASSKSTKSFSPPLVQSPTPSLPGIAPARSRRRGLDDPDYDPWNPPADAGPAAPASDQSRAGGAVDLWDVYDAPRLEPPARVKRKGEWTCSRHGSLCSPNVCKERDKRMRDERERWDEEKRLRDARRARKAETKGKGKGEWRERTSHFREDAPNNNNSSSNSTNVGSDSDASLDQGPSATPPRPDEEEWSMIPRNTGGTDTQSTWDARSSASSGAGTGTSPSTPSTPPTPLKPNGSPEPTITDTYWSDPFAMALAEMAKEDDRKNGGKGVNAETRSGQKVSKNARKRRNRDKTACAQAQAQAFAALASLLEAALDDELPPGGPGSSWGDPNEAW